MIYLVVTQQFFGMSGPSRSFGVTGIPNSRGSLFKLIPQSICLEWSLQCNLPNQLFSENALTLCSSGHFDGFQSCVSTEKLSLFESFLSGNRTQTT